jgi:hypothetical protein
MPRSTPRISLVSAVGDGIVLSDAQRATIERAYGYKLPPPVWDKIIAATSLLTITAPAISNAVPIKVALRKLQRLKAAALSLKQDLEPTIENAETASLTLEKIHKKYFRGPEPKHPISPVNLFPALLHSLNAVIDTSDYALTHLADDKEPFLQNFPEGYMWTVWVTIVSRILKNSGLPIAVRKDLLIRKHDVPSTFVFFIFEMQKHIPIECQRHMPSANSRDQKIYLDALSQAIYRARRS